MYRKLIMIDIQEMLRCRAAGHGIRRVADEVGCDRKTVRRYFAAADALAIARDRKPTDADIARLAALVQSQTKEVSDTGTAQTGLEAHRARIEGWLTKKPPLRLSKVHVLLQRDHGVQTSYTTLRRFAIEQLSWRKRAPTVWVADTAPGEVAQVDFGLMGKVVDSATQRVRKLWVLIVTLAFSRYQFVWPSFEQTTEAVCEGLDAAWRFFGGVPRVVVPDNMKAIVVRPNDLQPVLTPAFVDYMQARGFFVDVARVRSPKDKPRVENQVPYVRESWFAGESFLDLADMRTAAARWCGDVAGRRIHGTTRKVPRDVFETEELAFMLPPPTEVFDVPRWTRATVHPDCHVAVLQALYSIPHRYKGREVRVRCDRTTVKIYLANELIKMHPRVAPGRRSTDDEDYPPGRGAVAKRDVETLVARAKAEGIHVGLYAERLLDVPLPWTRMRRVYALLRLCTKFGRGRVEAICQSALAFDVVDVQRITRMLEQATKPAAPSARERTVVPLPLPRFARSTEHFATRVTKGEVS